VTLEPGERRKLVARYALADLGAASAVVEVEGWNVSSRVAR